MAAINTALVSREVSNLAKRQNWAAKEAGVVVVFCIVFIGMSLPCRKFTLHLRHLPQWAASHQPCCTFSVPNPN